MVENAMNYPSPATAGKRKLPVPRTGPIQLQTHGGEIRWRNIFLREIASEEAAQILSDKAKAAPQ